jgi:hypothetical protein
MFLSLFVSGCQCALLSLEASNVIGMRLQTLAKGDGAGSPRSRANDFRKTGSFRAS